MKAVVVMKVKATFYHAGCPVCLDAERQLAHALDPARYNVETVHLGQQRARLDEAKRQGVQSVPALVIEGQPTPLHINYGAALRDLG